MVVRHDRDDRAGHRLLVGSLRHVALRAQDHPGETVGNGLCHDFLGAEHRIEHGSAVDRLDPRHLLQGR